MEMYGIAFFCIIFFCFSRGFRNFSFFLKTTLPTLKVFILIKDQLFSTANAKRISAQKFILQIALKLQGITDL